MKLIRLFRKILFVGLIVCFLINLTMKSPVVKFRQKWSSDESAWETAKHGDLATFSMFLRENLLKKVKNNCSDCELGIPNPQNYNKSQFLGKFWIPIPSIYLFPLNIKVSDDYMASLKAEEFQMLKKLPLLERKYRSSFLHQKRNYYFVRDLKCDNYKKWVVYTFSEDSLEHIFVLPIDFKFVLTDQPKSE